MLPQPSGYSAIHVAASRDPQTRDSRWPSEASEASPKSSAKWLPAASIHVAADELKLEQKSSEDPQVPRCDLAPRLISKKRRKTVAGSAAVKVGELEEEEEELEVDGEELALTEFEELELEQDGEEFVLAGVVPGPSCLEEVLLVLHPMVVTALQQLEVLLGGPVTSIANAHWKKIIVTTSYSGMDFPGAALQQLKSHFESCGVHFEFELYAATDINNACKTALLQKKDPPKHVFDSILDRIPQDLKEELMQEARLRRLDVQHQLDARFPDFPAGSAARAKSDVRIRIAYTYARRQLIQEHSQTHARRMRILLQRIDVSQYEKAWCWSCQKMCSALPSKSKETLLIEVAGSTCVAFSTMSSSAWGLLDDSALPFFAWMFWSRHCKFDCILHECVPSIPIELADNIICHGTEDPLQGNRLYHNVSSIVNSPINFGIPCCRRRRYSRWTLVRDASAVVKVDASVAAPQIVDTSAAAPRIQSHRCDRVLESKFGSVKMTFNERNMRAMFYRKVAISSDVFLKATKQQIETYYRKRAHARNVPLCSEGEVDVLDLISASSRVHLEAGQQLRREALAGARVAPDIVCLNQSPHQLKPRVCQASMVPLMPALLTNSLPFSLAASRLLLVEELMMVMGLPTPSMASNNPVLASLCPYKDDMTSFLSETDVRRLLGNGMHISQVGSALLLLLCEAIVQTS